jgi:hypothetical protein
LNWVNEVDSGAGEAGNRLVMRLAGSRDGLGNHPLDLVAGLGAIKQDGTPALPIGHFLFQKRVTPRTRSQRLDLSEEQTETSYAAFL